MIIVPLSNGYGIIITTSDTAKPLKAAKTQKKIIAQTLRFCGNFAF